jgi:imidazolonepropionase-like amidohydrolase
MRIILTLSLLLLATVLQAQKTFPLNDVADNRNGKFAFTHATIIQQAGNMISDATMVIENGKILSVGNNIPIPADAVEINCGQKFIYPSFVDLYADYGMPAIAKPATRFNYNAPAQLTSNTKGAYGWNQAIRSEIEAANLFVVNEIAAKGWRDLGFGAGLTHHKDGIARGTGAVVTFANQKENKVILKEKASAHFSFNKGSSSQSYPSSMMGCIALLRQTHLDALWYRTNPSGEGVNLSLKSWNEQMSLPHIFEANDKWNAIRADRIGDEFGIQYIIKAGGNEYQRIKEISATKASFILPLNFPATMDVEDANNARYVSLEDMRHWQNAPFAPAIFEKNKVPFCLTAADLSDPKEFWPALRKAIQYGLSEAAAIRALTETPAKLSGIYNVCGSLESGKIANFIITNDSLFKDKTIILQHWIQGEKYSVQETQWNSPEGSYELIVQSADQKKSWQLEIKSDNSSFVRAGADTLASKFSFDGKQVQLNITLNKKDKDQLRLSGVAQKNQWAGIGEDAGGKPYSFEAKRIGNGSASATGSTKKVSPEMPALRYPSGAYGMQSLPTAETILIQRATVWTNEKEGILSETDVLVQNGKIAAIGKNISPGEAKVIDGKGMHLTPGIIDEHSHIATSSINEGGQSVTSEVRIGDNLDPEDINIYRQLSGGVTSSHILHGSANTIGGQTQLIKLKWGYNDEEMKFKGWPGFIKFALGENVKRTTSSQNNRFPDTRMGVSQVLIDAFNRATAYKASWAVYEKEKMKNKNAIAPRKDLELETLVEIMDKKRFITCHSYVQSEITDIMRVAEKYGFVLNTFTHILEGYKVADKMKAHGANASSFSDWWNYKMEVVDAIPFNAAIMHEQGINVAINSDDAEMARRLNQEAAKSVKYGGMSEEDAFKMVTLNPAKMLHVDDRVGSIRTGKDADLVLWNDHPLSIYAQCMVNIIDGAIFFDRKKDNEQRATISKDRAVLIQKMLDEKKDGKKTAPFAPSMKTIYHCSDHQHKHGLFVIDGEN